MGAALRNPALSWTSAGFAAAGAAAAFFFRDPRRVTPAVDAGLIVSPADGRVSDVMQVDEPHFLKCKSLRVGIFLSLFDVHIQRFPLDGVVVHRDHRPGRFRPAFHPRAAADNQQALVGMDCGRLRILVKQIAGAVARRIVCRAEVGQTVSRGGKLGLIRFGSRVELYVPAGTTVLVRPGDRVRAGESIVGVCE
jgi:phosphatidylserine decarboxylase